MTAGANIIAKYHLHVLHLNFQHWVLKNNVTQ